MRDGRLLIGELAGELGVNPRTIRYYEELGLLPEPERTEGNYRLYGPGDRERLAFILRARRLDFSLEEIGGILGFREAGEVPCPYVLGQIDRRIGQIRDRIAELERLERELVGLKHQAEAVPPEERARRGRICHIVENESLTGA